MRSVRTRVTAGVGAWIVGATAATGLSLFAVSYLGEDPQNPHGATLSQAQVEQALASMTGAPDPSTAPDSPTPSGAVTTGATPSTPAAPTAPPSSATSTHTAPARSAAAGQPVDRRLSGDAGTVLAQCQGSIVYLVTWSPAQGYQAEASQRGPAHLATVVFTGYGKRIEFHVGCLAGIPALVEADDGRIDH
jgi:hypothetical protein